MGGKLEQLRAQAREMYKRRQYSRERFTDGPRENLPAETRRALDQAVSSVEAAAERPKGK